QGLPWVEYEIRNPELFRCPLNRPGGLGARFDFRGDQTDLVHAGGVGNINHIGDIGKRDGVITLHEHDLFRALLVDIGETTLQVVPSRVFGIDLDARRLARTPVDQLHDDGTVGVHIFGSVRRRRLRNQRIQSFRSHRRDHHEDDQQHQQYVNERRDVDVCTLASARADCHTHDRSPRYFSERDSLNAPKSDRTDSKPANYCPGVTGGGGVLGAVFFCSVSKPRSSTPAARTASTTCTTLPNRARMSAFTYTRLSGLLARRSLTLPVRLSTAICSLPKYTLPSRVMETSSASSLSASGICSGLLTGAISTLIPFCNMGVTTMKMISRTSITSTMGVTLISELTFAPSFRFANAMAWYLPYFSRTCTARSRGFQRPRLKLGRPGAGSLQRRTSNSLRKPAVPYLTA